jgi:assimilatory nitrate reductase catalytic subunit
MTAHETRSTCPYCGVGCGVIIETQTSNVGLASSRVITGVRGDPDHPANFGRLCTKGSTLHLSAGHTLTQHTRMLYPMARATRNDPATRVHWTDALEQAAQKFAQVISDHGPNSVGFYISGQLLTEDYYVFNKLVKGQIGTNNLDTNSRLCMSSAVAGYKMTLGADAPPSCYEDIDHAQCLFIVGSNTAWAHPILFRRIEDAKKANPDLKIIFCDPRKTDTAGIADLYLPIQPGTDVMLFHGMLHIMLWEGWVDQTFIAEHTQGFEALRNVVRDCTPDLVAQTCGISKEALQQATQWFARAKASMSLYCQGLNQSSSGTAKNAALINLHLATGQIGKAGAGPFSLTGQPNAMGGREVGGLANLISAHRDMANPAHRAEVAKLWGLADVPSAPGKTAVEMFQAAADGEIKALWIACTNPAQSMPDLNTVKEALRRAEFVVLQEAFLNTETARFADLLLPASTWGEKIGTVTNSERRISRVRNAVLPPGEAHHDWQIVQDFGARLEKVLAARAGSTPPAQPFLNFNAPEDIWMEHRESTRGRDLDITGLSYELLDRLGPQQWPMPEGVATGKARLYEDGIFPTPDGRAKFAAVSYTPVAEARESRYPFSLTTGRLRDQWHGMSRTGIVARLFGHVPEPVIQMHPQDMARRLINEGDLVHVTSKRGSILVPAQGSAELSPSQAFMAMHWGGEYLGGCSSTGEPLAGVNALTTAAYCPSSKQPELKHAAVKILKAELPWTMLALAWLPVEQSVIARQDFQRLMRQVPFATCVPFASPTTLAEAGQQRQGLLLRAAGHQAPESAWFEQLESLLDLTGEQVLRYADVKKGQRRAMKLRRDGKEAFLEAFMLAGDTKAEAWVKTLLQEQRAAQEFGRMLLVPGAKPPVAIKAQSAQICSCFNVSDVQIKQHLLTFKGPAKERLASLQAALRCGTNCGSCLPELRSLTNALA